ncbi:MAG: uracil-DNA glycosylase family protein [Kordiimonadaceae bacterium]|nr:uracil-DNA glycosylase family protein [Kordiimonadaceae bacterium]MBO6570113.1 uracil-DNA glycosylase family protein [Kordiimonadaceae bacterium]MBO6965789.1 uracil-DNA glycosylase family protein [Kordiimonadaceae bacterium]
MAENFKNLVGDIHSCTICADKLPHGTRPVLQVSQKAKILIAGQAPGRRVHESGIPFDDPSGDRLRQWLGVDKSVFYDPDKIAIVPMGFCYPGTGKSGDLPPRKECASTWHSSLLEQMSQIELTVVIGQYAIDWHVPGAKRQTLTETVKNWRDHWPSKLVLPHPSPRNNIWLKKNPWFEDELLPPLRNKVQELLNNP